MLIMLLFASSNPEILQDTPQKNTPLDSATSSPCLTPQRNISPPPPPPDLSRWQERLSKATPLEISNALDALGRWQQSTMFDLNQRIRPDQEKTGR